MKVGNLGSGATMATKKKSTVPTLTPVYEYAAEVVRVLDGDSLEVMIEKDVGFDVLVRFKKIVRVVGIDAPEKFGATKQAGLAAKALVQSLLPPGTKVVLKTEKPDGTEKYGRFLAHVWLGDMNLSEHMIAAGAARAYDGGKR
jgi:micrococcal nuclease